MLKHLRDALRTSMTGMRITGRYFRPGTEVTRQYPDEPPLVFERTRGRLDVSMDRCTACLLCAKTCPADCITLETERKLEGKGRRAAVFTVDMSRCLFCGLCVEACPTGAIFHTGKCDFSAYTLEELIVDFGTGHYTEEEKRLAAKQKDEAAHDGGGEGRDHRGNE